MLRKGGGGGGEVGGGGVGGGGGGGGGGERTQKSKFFKEDINKLEFLVGGEGRGQYHLKFVAHLTCQNFIWQGLCKGLSVHSGTEKL